MLSLPLTAGDADEIYLEVVRGFGETLVGNQPGSPLIAVATKHQLEAAGSAVDEALRETHKAARCVQDNWVASCAVVMSAPCTITVRTSTAVWLSLKCLHRKEWVAYWR